MKLRATALAVAAVLVTGCGVNVQDGVGPRVPIPNVEGSVQRSGAPAAGVKVSLRTGAGAEIARASTTSKGYYGFDGVGHGSWQVRASGELPGDFDSVTRTFLLGDKVMVLRAIDIDAHGAAVTSPADGVSLPAATPAQPLVFAWILPGAPDTKARVQLFDASGELVWASAPVKDTQASWDGLGNQGSHAGIVTPPGTYSWRLKFDLPDTTEARLPNRSLTLQ